MRAGVKSIISFAPVPLQLPDDVFVEYMDITAALESAAFFARLGGRDAAGDRRTGEIEPMVKKLESLLARSNMKLEDLAENIGARVVTPGRPGGTEITRIYAGDRVSDLLNEASDKTLLVSNLASVQMLRVAELMDVPGICFVNGVEPGTRGRRARATERHPAAGLPRGRLRDLRAHLPSTSAGDARELTLMEHLGLRHPSGDFAAPARRRATSSST